MARLNRHSSEVLELAAQINLSWASLASDIQGQVHDRGDRQYIMPLSFTVESVGHLISQAHTQFAGLLRLLDE